MKEGSSYILIDIYENLWLAPEVFLKWQEAIDSRAMKDVEKSAFCFCLTWIGEEFRLYFSPRKDSLQSVRHPVPPPFSPLPKSTASDDDEEDEEEEAFPADEGDSDPDFESNKK